VTVFAVLADLRARGLLLGDRVVRAPLVPDHRVRDFFNLAARLPERTDDPTIQPRSR